MSMPKFIRKPQEPCKASYKVGPTVEMRGLPEPPHRCPECLHDSGWVIVSRVREQTSGAAPDLMPCRVCNPVQHRRWTEGHFVPGHSCEECVDIRAGVLGRLDYGGDGMPLVGSGGYVDVG